MTKTRPKEIIRLCADGQLLSITMKKKPTLEELKEWVGGYIEHVSVRFEGRAADLYLNEDGINQELPQNLYASKVFAGQFLMHKHRVLGDVVIVRPFIQDA